MQRFLNVNRLRPYIPVLFYVLIMLLIAGAAMNGQNNIMFWIFGVMAAGLIISLLSQHLMLRGIEIRRLDPQHGAVGEPLVLEYAVRNRRRFLPVFNLFIEEVADRSTNWQHSMNTTFAWVLHVPPRETVHTEVILWPRERGSVRFERLRCRVTFPFGVLRRTRRIAQPTHTLVYPRHYALRPRVLESITPTGPLGMRLSSRSGGGDDFFGLREYQPGHGLRAIAWKRSAGASELVVIERTQPSPPRLRVVLNLRGPTEEIMPDESTGRSARHLEEDAISIAASLVDGATVAGYEVGLAVLGCDAPITPLRRSHWHLEKMMSTLAAIDLDEDPARRTNIHGLLPDSERAGVIVVHPRQIEPSIGGQDAWHFTAMQMSRLVAEPIIPSRPVLDRPSGIFNRPQQANAATGIAGEGATAHHADAGTGRSRQDGTGQAVEERRGKP